MADDLTLPGTGERIALEEVTTLNGVTVTAQKIQRITLSIITSNGVAQDVTGNASGIYLQGPVAHGNSVGGNPILNGLEARKATLATPVAAGQVVRAAADHYGRQITVGPTLLWASSNATPITTATDTIAVAAPGAGNFLRVYVMQTTQTTTVKTITSFKDGVGGARRFHAYLLQGGVYLNTSSSGVMDCTANTALYINTDAAGSVHWTVGYEILAV